MCGLKTLWNICIRLFN